MRSRRIFVTRAEIGNHTISFSAANMHYLKNVLHFGLGDCFKAVDGTRLYDVVLEAKNGCELIGKILSSTEDTFAFPVKVDLAFGCIRPAPTEEIIRHCTEIGVDSFSPLLFERSNRRPNSVRNRWLKIASSACAQSGRWTMPTFNDPMDLEHFLDLVSRDSCLVYFCLGQATPPFGTVLDSHKPEKMVMVIGPEGGMSHEEKSRLDAFGFVPASLGPTILRTETAAIVAAGIVTNWGLTRMCGQKSFDSDHFQFVDPCGA
ncbi:MAG: RsmE family RNA methyltransferase [Desulfomonilaceae bacterium]